MSHFDPVPVPLDVADVATKFEALNEAQQLRVSQLLGEFEPPPPLPTSEEIAVAYDALDEPGKRRVRRAVDNATERLAK